VSRPVSIVIPSWNGRALLERNLPSVRAALAAHPAGGEAIIVDDGSRDGTSAWIGTAHPWARCLPRSLNEGFGAAVNHGVEAARHTIVILLNNDMRVAERFLEPLTAPFEARGGRLFAVAPTIINRTFGGNEAVTACRFRFGLLETLFPERNGASQSGPDPAAAAGTTGAETTGAAEILFACGGAAAFDRGLWQTLGGLDPLYAPFYWEDVDLSWRARKRGLLILHEPASVVYHEHAATIGAHFAPPLVRAVYERNRLLFQWKNLTSAGLTARHLAWLPARLARSPLGRIDFLKGFLAATRRLPRALGGRRRERKAALLGDEAILERFER